MNEHFQLPNFEYITRLDLLQNSILKFYAHNIIELKELSKIKTIFEQIDENGDGTLSKREVEDVMTKMGQEKKFQKVIINFY